MITLNVGDFLGEITRLQVKAIQGDAVTLTNLNNGREVTYSKAYAESLCDSAHYFDKTVEVGIEDKFWTASQIAKEKPGDDIRAGDLKLLGIQSLFKNIGSEVFTVVFKKQDTPKTKKAYKEEVDKAIAECKADPSRFEHYIKNPILDYVPGELRTLHGVKLEFNSLD